MTSVSPTKSSPSTTDYKIQTELISMKDAVSQYQNEIKVLTNMNQNNAKEKVHLLDQINQLNEKISGLLDIINDNNSKIDQHVSTNGKLQLEILDLKI